LYDFKYAATFATAAGGARGGGGASKHAIGSVFQKKAIKRMRGREIDSIAEVRDHVIQAARIARRAQQQLSYDARQLKSDDSVITATDLRVERLLNEQIKSIYPQANVIGEETVRSLEHSHAYTFVIDPIDGTDVYSQGMHGWCVSVGLLDETLRPVAGVVVSPRLDLILFADVGQPATLNGQPLQPNGRLSSQSKAPAGLAGARDPLPLDATTNVMVHSRTHQRIDLSRYPGKIRSIGSASLHICFTLIYPGIYAAIEGKGEHVWDIAGAHAILLSHGYELSYLSGRQLDYQALIHGEGTSEPLLAGYPEHVRSLRSMLQSP
jgi:fructose-1,6-bisphosphatase/inositol monophosphatase family enzyme